MWSGLIQAHPLPRWLAASNDDRDATGPSPRAPLEPRIAGARLLIIEDEWLIAVQLESYLQAAGCEIVGIAADEREALRLAAAALPDLALVDIRLAGGADGIRAAEELRARHDIPSLFVSGNLDPQSMARAARVDPAGYLHKPFTAHELVEAVERALASPQAGN
jgi:DNA-binding NarL/FixJ family response regulator